MLMLFYYYIIIIVYPFVKENALIFYSQNFLACCINCSGDNMSSVTCGYCGQQPLHGKEIHIHDYLLCLSKKTCFDYLQNSFNFNMIDILVNQYRVYDISSYLDRCLILLPKVTILILYC